METSTYRPRNAGHDYYGRGTYLITLVVSGREPLLSHFSTTGRDALKGGDILRLTPLGEVVEQTWLKTQEAQAVQEMAAGGLLLPHDGGQVHDPVGLVQEGIVCFKALRRFGRQRQAPFRRAGEQRFTQAHFSSL